MELVLYKSKKRLELREHGQLIKAFPVAIGKSTVGHKIEEGDMKTPEGEYFICVKNPGSKFHLSLGLNYPNNEDAKAGLERGQISKEECDAICEANDGGRIPPWKTALGGEIFIHGELEKQDWSHGCIRLYNPDIEALYKLVSKGTRITIKP